MLIYIVVLLSLIFQISFRGNTVFATLYAMELQAQI